jgi:phenylacetate-CoA ligase
MADEHMDDLETRDPEVRERQLFAALPELIRHAKRAAPAIGRLLADVSAAEVRDRAALALLPVLRKSELIARQAETMPFGGLAAVAPGTMSRIFASPGPIYDPETRKRDYWRFARALHAAGFRKGEILHNCFAYHFTPAGAMIETGAHALGCAVFPGGTGQTESQVRAIADLKPAGYGGTPSFLKIILEKAREMGADVSSLKKALVSGEALPPALRCEIASHGCAALQAYGSADLGLVAYESSAREGMILDEQVVVEIVRPGTGDPVSDGEVGEVVVTTFNRAYPLIRFATGDLSAILPGTSPCGRTNARIRGWLGRADQTTKVKGMFVHPEQVAKVLKRHPEIARARLVVTRPGDNDVMTLKCEIAGTASAELAAAISATLQAETRLRGDIEPVASGTLPNDGKVIEDARPPG